jgi:hypothetical protein
MQFAAIGAIVRDDSGSLSPTLVVPPHVEIATPEIAVTA